MFTVDREESYSYKVPLLLDSGIRVLVYSGMLDLICNYVGGEMWTSAMQWSGQPGFVSAQYAPWVISGQTAGYFKGYEGLTWLEVEGAGHMVPHDQPSNALAMLKTFLSNQPFGKH